MELEILFGVLIPPVGTVLGSACVFFIGHSGSGRLTDALVGFASGVMVAASVWSLLLPAIELCSRSSRLSSIPAVIGFALGVAALLFTDRFLDRSLPERDSPGRRSSMIVLSVTAHNLPEGMAVGAVYAALLSGDTAVTLMSATLLSIGIGIQNFPEGAIISMPLRADGKSRTSAFLRGAASGIVEPVGAVLVILFTRLFLPALPYLLGAAAGAMVYVVVEELIPSVSGRGSKLSVVMFSVGFLLMMTLDTLLG